MRKGLDRLRNKTGKFVLTPRDGDVLAFFRKQIRMHLIYADRLAKRNLQDDHRVVRGQKSDRVSANSSFKHFLKWRPFGRRRGEERTYISTLNNISIAEGHIG
jgi:hypothetical protein